MKTTMTLGTFEAKNRFSELLDRVSRGGEVTITRHDKPVAKLVPAKSASAGPSIYDRMDALRSKNSLAPGETAKDLINEGRRI